MGVNSKLYIIAGLPAEIKYYEEGYTEESDFDSKEEYLFYKAIHDSENLTAIGDMDNDGFIGKVLFESDDGRYDVISVEESFHPNDLYHILEDVYYEIESIRMKIVPDMKVDKKNAPFGIKDTEYKLHVWMCYS